VTETETTKKVKKESRKNDEGLSTNVFKPKEPYIGRCLLNTKIVGDDAPGETWHMVFTTEGLFPSMALFETCLLSCHIISLFHFCLSIKKFCVLVCVYLKNILGKLG
jgi:hypothetical protein